MMLVGIATTIDKVIYRIIKYREACSTADWMINIFAEFFINILQLERQG
jgi:hypothetical protein